MKFILNVSIFSVVFYGVSINYRKKKPGEIVDTHMIFTELKKKKHFSKVRYEIKDVTVYCDVVMTRT